ncbi:MAG: sulfatase [Phycisphaerae bacterium]|nr:sulfatase [Phycisphaerae bacterium]
MNIVLVVFDTLRKDCVGCYGQSPSWSWLDKYGPVETPHLDAFAAESLVMTRAFPESLPTLPTRRALYTGQRVYPFHDADFKLKGDFVGAPGWGPIPEEQPTLAEMFKEAGYRTGLIADVYHMFKPSKNFWRGFDQWTFLRGQEIDTARSGPAITPEQIDYWLPKAWQSEGKVRFITACLLNMHDRLVEEDYFNARVFQEAVRWLQQNRDADNFFLTVESFDPHEPWFVPEHYRRRYDPGDGPEQVVSGYSDIQGLGPGLVTRTQANYAGLVTMCDRWFGHLMEALRVLGRLDDTMVIVTSDHGHSLGENDWIGKRGYPSTREVFDVPILVRHPQGLGAGQTSDLFVQHTDMTATILSACDIKPTQKLHGKDFWAPALSGGAALRDHVTVAWGSAVTVVNDRWWFNAKANGRGVFLYDIADDPRLGKNVADDHPDVVKELFGVACADAEGGFPDFILDLADRDADAPGCSDLVGRKRD